MTQKRYPPSRCLTRSFAVLWVLIALPACGRTDAGKGGPRAEPPPAPPDLDRCTQDADCRLSPKLLRGEARSDEAFCCAGTCPVMRAYSVKRLDALEAEYRQRCPQVHFGCPKTDCMPPPVGVARCVAGACQQVGGKGRGR